MSPRLHAVPAPGQRAVGYVRVSQERTEMISPDLQRLAIEEHCARHGYQLLEVVEDLDMSGRSWAKRQVEQLVGRIEAGDADVLVVWKWSRVARNRRDWAVANDRVDVAGGRIESATEDVDVSTSTGRLTRGMLAELAAWESERIGEQWKETHAHRVARGLPHTATARFGYTYNRTTDLHVPDSNLGPILADLYRRYTGGESATLLIRWLNAHSIPTTRGGPWQGENVLFRMLDSGFGAGRIVRHGQLIGGAHQPVIGEGEWDAYQARRAQQRRTPTRLRNPAHVLSGILRCAACGGPMHAYPSKRRTGGYATYFRCNEGNRHHRCRGAWVSETKAVRLVLEWLAVQASDRTVRQAADTSRKLAAAAARAERRRLAGEVERADVALTRLTVDLASGLVPVRAYEQARDELAATRAEAAERLADLRADLDALAAPVPARAKALLAAWGEADVAAKRQALQALVRRIEVTAGGHRGATVVVVPVWDD